MVKKAIFITLAILAVSQVADAGSFSISSVTNTQINPGTVYTLKVVANSTGIPTEGIIAASWHINIPVGITITGAALPGIENPSTNPDDYFYGYTMKAGRSSIDSTIDGSLELTDNGRAGIVAEGVKNRIGDLGWYYFTVDSSLIGQTLTFNLNHVYILNSLTHNVPVEITTSQFSVVPEPATVSILGFGALAIRLNNKRKQAHR